MAQLPALGAKQVIRILARLGFIRVRQKGSHLVMINPKTRSRTVIPIHPSHTIKKPLLIAIISQAGVSVEEFLSNE